MFALFLQDLTDNPLKKKAVDNKIDVTNHIPSQKNMSPLDKKINGKGQQANSAVQKEHWKYR